MTVIRSLTDRREIRHFHLFCGLGGGARGFNQGEARVGNMEAVYRCIGGVDVVAAAIADFGRAAGVRGTVLDMFSRAQYTAFHGHEPPPGWREATPEDIRRAANGLFPHIVFLSAPCKGFSGLLSQARSITPKYQALNELTLRGIWLMLEAFKDNLPELIIFENVPLIASRGRALLDQIQRLLTAYGYLVSETTHDCGEIGHLAQSRKRFLKVARHAEKVPPFLFEPVKRPLRGVGEVIGQLPLPGDIEQGGPMHRIPRLQWQTWVRLAFVEAGKDWRSLNRLAVVDGRLRDYLIVPQRHHGYLGVNGWKEPSGTVAGASGPSNGAFSVADPRFDKSRHWNDGQQFGVHGWDDSTGAITGQRSPAQGRFSVADPRFEDIRHNNVYRVVDFSHAAGTVTGGWGPSSGGQSVADPRPPQRQLFAKYAVTPWSGSTGTVIGGDDAGAFAVADPRPGFQRKKGDHYLTAGHYGVVPWKASSGAVSAAACHDNGRWSVADPRPLEGERLPAKHDKLVAVICSLDGTWHRPFTTLELAALQGLVDPGEFLELEGLSDSAWRERIGNAVPSPAAKAIADVMGQTLLLAWSGETFVLGSTPIWVRNLAATLSVDHAPLLEGGDA